MTKNEKTNEIIQEIFAKCHHDPAYKARFLSDPKPIIEEAGIALPASTKVEVIEDSEPNLLTLHLPPEPSEELSDEDLGKISGGNLTIMSANTFPDTNLT